MEEKYVVYQINGFDTNTNTYINGNLVKINYEGLTKEEATLHRNFLNKMRTQWQKEHIGIVYKFAKENKVKRY